MKKIFKALLSVAIVTCFCFANCDDGRPANTTALDEQAHTEDNQSILLKNQPLPTITWSMERDNLIKLKKLQNDRTINFYMYVFNEGIADPIGYYLVNKVSSVNSQLSNTEQIVSQYMHGGWESFALPSPSEDGSYGSNGESVFGFTPEDICIQTNMHFITATVPLHFSHPVNRLAIIDSDEAIRLLQASKKAMGSTK